MSRSGPDPAPSPGPATITFQSRDAAATARLGRALAAHLRAGDLVILSGELGAGKTTFTQGVGAGLGVRGPVTSPTFVISRVHPSRGGGPALVHVDAYRLGSGAEIDDLDLDTDLDEAVVIVEWGAGRAESIAESRLEVNLTEGRCAAERVITVRAVGPRWAGAGLAGLR